MRFGWTQRRKNKAQIAELVTQIVALRRVAPRASKECFIGERAQQSKVTLGRIMHSGENSIDDRAFELRANDQIGLPRAGRQLTSMLNCAALECSHDGCSHRDHTTAV